MCGMTRLAACLCLVAEQRPALSTLPAAHRGIFNSMNQMVTDTGPKCRDLDKYQDWCVAP